MSDNESCSSHEGGGSRLHRTTRRLTNSISSGNFGRRFRQYSIKRRKPIVIAVVTLVALLVVLAAVLIVVLTRSHSTTKPKKNDNAQVVTFLFNTGYKPLGRAKRGIFDSGQLDEGRIVIKKAIEDLRENITRGDIVVDLIPYADVVIYDRIQKGLSDVNSSKDIVDQIYDNAPYLNEKNPNQYGAINYYLANSTDNKKESKKFEHFVLDEQQKQNSSFIFVAPKKRLYDTNENRFQDSKNTGVLIKTVHSSVGNTFLVGLDGDNNMTRDYGLESSDIPVLTDGVHDIDKITDSIKNNIPLVLTTPAPPPKIVTEITTQKMLTTTTTKKPSTSTTQKVPTTTTTPSPEETTEYQSEGTSEEPYASSQMPNEPAAAFEMNPDNVVYIPVE